MIDRDHKINKINKIIEELCHFPYRKPSNELESKLEKEVIKPVYDWWVNNKEIQMAGLYEQEDLIDFILHSEEYKIFIRDYKLNNLGI